MVTLSQSILTLSAAAHELPGPSGKALQVSTLWRWSVRGVRGTRLETVIVGGIRYTSREALERFVVSTTNAANGSTPSVRTPKQRQRAIEAADRELAEAAN